jgi:sialate O-acetylesterase
MLRRLCIALMMCLWLPLLARAERPFIPKLFADGMVLQRDAAVPIWGFAPPAKPITVRFGGQTVSAVTDPSGRWQATLAPMPASSQGQDLVIESDVETMTLRDVLVGDVYLLAGQSNMSWPLRAAQDDAVIAAADHPWLRVFLQATTDGAQSDRGHDVAWGKWKTCTPESAGAMSGLGYHFATELHRHVDVPIGLIHTAVGGTRIESWIDLPTLRTIPTIANYFQAVERSEARYAQDEAEYKPRLAEWEKTKTGRKPAMSNMLGLGRFRRPAALFNGLVAPHQPAALRGVIWYQGEGNASNDPTHYRHALRTLIDAWRRDFNQPQLPFLIVQLPGYHDGKQWPGTREAQRHVAATTPHAGLIVTLDTGDPADLHPRSKVEIGRRAARIARSMIHGQAITAGGPVARNARRSDEVITLTFDHAGTGLRLTNGDPSNRVVGIEIDDGSGTFSSAKASITGPNQVAIESAGRATKVRYAWSAIPSEANLTNETGIPAAGFLLESIEAAP